MVETAEQINKTQLLLRQKFITQTHTFTWILPAVNKSHISGGHTHRLYYREKLCVFFLWHGSFVRSVCIDLRK